MPLARASLRIRSSSTGTARLDGARVLLALVLVCGVVIGVFPGTQETALATPSISQTYFTPFEVQQLIDVLWSIGGGPGVCTGPVESTISITSGIDSNTVYYDHFEDGYEIDPVNPI